MFRFALARPSPEPAVFVEKYGSNARRTASASIPTPVSPIVSSTVSPRSAAVTVSLPPAGIACTAFSTRLVSARAMSVRSICTAGRLDGTLTSMSTRCARPSR